MRVEVSPDLISTVTDAVVAEVTAWQARPLEPMYPVVFFDALRGQDSRRRRRPQQGRSISRSAVLPDGTPRHPRALDRADRRREVLDEGLHAICETRGCHDILIAVTDGLKGMSEALAGGVSRRRRCRRASST